VIGETEQEVQDRLDWTRDHYLKAGLSEQVVDGQMAGLRSGPAVGTPEQIIENLSALQDQGMTYAIAYFTEAAYDTTGMHLFENHVIPALQ
jgi:alkanesulfonate monooxygenase SsuD/methylene tetrahydromethanopterin reductase-like flavin-dependent oxidoreductase (luciferase family)